MEPDERDDCHHLRPRRQRPADITVTAHGTRRRPRSLCPRAGRPAPLLSRRAFCTCSRRPRVGMKRAPGQTQGRSEQQQPKEARRPDPGRRPAPLRLRRAASTDCPTAGSATTPSTWWSCTPARREFIDGPARTTREPAATRPWSSGCGAAAGWSCQRRPATVRTSASCCAGNDRPGSRRSQRRRAADGLWPQRRHVVRRRVHSPRPRPVASRRAST